MRRLLIALVLVFAAPAAAATIHAPKHGGTILGTAAPDHLVGGPGNDFVQAAWGGIDRVDCGGGFNVVAADLGDKVAANCQVVSRRLSVDTSTNPAGQHETAVEPADFAWGTTVVAAYQVGRFANGGASNIGFAVSNDSGRTWTRGLLPGVTVESTPAGPERAASDPSVAYDVAHGVWLISTLTIEQGGTRVMVAHSSDGLHWSAPVTAAAGPALDKDWVACDNGASSPFRGRCYALYTDDNKNITVSQSSDDGGVTWSTPVRATGVLVGTQPAVLPDGTLVTIAGNYLSEQALTGTIESLRSTDGGATFTRVDARDAELGEQRPHARDLASVPCDRLRGHPVRVVGGLPLPRVVQRERHRHLELDGRRDLERAVARARRSHVVDARRDDSRARRRPEPARPSRTRVRVLHARLVRERRMRARHRLRAVPRRRRDLDEAAPARR